MIYIRYIYHDIYHTAQKALDGALARVITIEYTAHATVPEGIALFPWVGMASAAK